jgi:uncharacterized protein
MEKRSWTDKIKRLAKAVYLKLFRINDSPLKIALGFGLGVFTGIMPGAGPVAAVLLAVFFRVNRAGALLGSLLFNTWFSVAALLVSMKLGAAVTGRHYQDVCAGWEALIKNFKWGKLFEASVYEILVPVAMGYLIVALAVALMAAGGVYMIVSHTKGKKC